MRVKLNKRYKNNKICFFVWLTFFVFFTIEAQKKPLYTIGGSYNLGTNINKASDREFGNTNPVGAELYFHRHRNGTKYWEKIFNYPHTGWALSWIDHRNKFLGSTFSLSRYLSYVFWRTHNFELYIKGAQGLMFAKDTYETGSNSRQNYNNAISQQFNFSEQLGIGLSIYSVKHLGVNIAATMTHFSNAAISQPNDGLNLIMLQLGLTYITDEHKNLLYNQTERPVDNKRIRFNFQMAGGAKQLNPENARKYPLFTFYFYADKKLTRISAINLGTDVFMNTGVKHNIENSANKSIDYKRVGVSAGHELFIDKMGILTQVGYHVYTPYPAISNFYQKVGLKYYFAEKLFAALTIRLFNFEISDEVAWGIGLRM